MSGQKIYNVAVIGAGVFGAWTAWQLARRGQRVLLADAYGAANSRASSGGESRIIRMGYGADELYTRWAQRSLESWKEFLATTRQRLFHETGVLWLAGKGDTRLSATMAALKKCNVAFEEMDTGALERCYPQITFDGGMRGMLEPRSGVLMARRAVAAVVEESIRSGVEFRIAHIAAPRASKRLESVKCSSGESIVAGQYVFACGAWLGKVFPEILGPRIFPSRQEVFFLGVPAGDPRFSAPALPTWLFQDDEVYGMPDLESRGMKIAFDHHGPPIDPDTESRTVTPDMTEAVRKYVGRRFPALHGAPVLETRVCQYENTSSGDFLIDRHPTMENVWFAGGGSGHGFKHGPAVGEYVAALLLDAAQPETRFLLATKETLQKRAVY